MLRPNILASVNGTPSPLSFTEIFGEEPPRELWAKWGSCYVRKLPLYRKVGVVYEDFLQHYLTELVLVNAEKWAFASKMELCVGSFEPSRII